MEHIREYLLSVTAAALLCGTIRSLTGEKGSIGGILRLVCGIFLAFTVIRPVADIQLREFALLTTDVLTDAEAAAAEGEDYAHQAMARLIKEEAEAYILDKAQALGVRISVEVSVSEMDPPVPAGCTILGDLSPYARQQLKHILQSDLGIPEEDQQWIASSSSS